MLGLQLGDTAEPPSNLVADHAQKKHKQRLEVWRPWCCWHGQAVRGRVDAEREATSRVEAGTKAAAAQGGKGSLGFWKY